MAIAAVFLLTWFLVGVANLAMAAHLSYLDRLNGRNDWKIDNDLISVSFVLPPISFIVIFCGMIGAYANIVKNALNARIDKKVSAEQANRGRDAKQAAAWRRHMAEAKAMLDGPEGGAKDIKEEDDGIPARRLDAEA